MKFWWLRLYTIPSLKKLTWPLSAWWASNFLVAFLLPDIREITFLVAAWPWFVFFNDNEYTLGNNLDFHRVNVPYRELRKALLMDVLIQVGLFITVFFLGGYLPWMGRNGESRILDVLGTPATTALFFITFLFFIASPKLGIVKQRQAETAVKIKERLTKRKGGGIFAGAFLLFCVYLVEERGLSMLLVCYVGASAAFISTLIEWYLDNFHLFPEWRRKAEFVIPPALVVLFALLTLGLSSKAREEIVDEGLNPVRRMITFQMYQDFGIILDHHTAADLIEVAYSPESFEEIFEHSAPDVFEMEIDRLIKRPDYRAYYHYLQTGKVRPHNLKALLSKTLQDKEAWGNPYYYQKFRESLVKHYPEASKLPVRNIASQKGRK